MGDERARRAGALACVVPEGLRAVARDLARLVVPVQCPGCGRWDELLCAACARALAGPPRRCETDAPRLDRGAPGGPLPVWTLAAYTGPVRGTVVAWKDRGRLDLGDVLRAAARRGGAGIWPDLRSAVADEQVAVVGVPSGRAARRRRGADLVGELAASVAAGLRDAGVRAERADLLRPSRRTRDQVGLGARARSRNTRGAFHVTDTRRTGGRTAGRDGTWWVLLVDDVLTTGSTLAAAGDALERVGRPVLGALVVAATPAPTQDLGDLPPPDHAG